MTGVDKRGCITMKRQEKREAIAEKKQELDQLMAEKGENRVDQIITFLSDQQIALHVGYDTELQTVYKMGQICEMEKHCGEPHLLLDFSPSIKDAIDLYADLRNICLRIENDIPEAFWPTGIDGDKALLSGVAFYKIIERETEKKEKNINVLARMLRQKGMLIAAIRLLQLGTEKYKKEEQLALQLADCWISCGKLRKAYQALEHLEEPSEETRRLKQELKRVTENENI